MQRAVRKHETTPLENASKFDRMPTEVLHKLLQDFNLQFDGVPVQYVSHQVHRQKQTLETLQKPAIVRVKATCTNDFPESLKNASIWNANSGTGKATSLLEEYNINREEGGDPELTLFQRNFFECSS